ncbi:hypothetical protein NN561_018966 [Cricetulus griseus]
MRILDFWREGPGRGAKRREGSIAPARNELLLRGGWPRRGEAAGQPCGPAVRSKFQFGTCNKFALPRKWR